MKPDGCTHPFRRHRLGFRIDIAHAATNSIRSQMERMSSGCCGSAVMSCSSCVLQEPRRDPGAASEEVMLMLQAGTYTVTYSATDKEGNVGTASRSVVVASPCVSPNFFCPATCRSASNVVLLWTHCGSSRIVSNGAGYPKLQPEWCNHH